MDVYYPLHAHIGSIYMHSNYKQVAYLLTVGSFHDPKDNPLSDNYRVIALLTWGW